MKHRVFFAFFLTQLVVGRVAWCLDPSEEEEAVCHEVMDTFAHRRALQEFKVQVVQVDRVALGSEWSAACPMAKKQQGGFCIQ